MSEHVPSAPSGTTETERQDVVSLARALAAAPADAAEQIALRRHLAVLTLATREIERAACHCDECFRAAYLRLDAEQEQRYARQVEQADEDARWNAAPAVAVRPPEVDMDRMRQVCGDNWRCDHRLDVRWRSTAASSEMGLSLHVHPGVLTSCTCVAFISSWVPRG